MSNKRFATLCRKKSESSSVKAGVLLSYNLINTQEQIFMDKEEDWFINILFFSTLI